MDFSRFNRPSGSYGRCPPVTPCQSPNTFMGNRGGMMGGQMNSSFYGQQQQQQPQQQPTTPPYYQGQGLNWPNQPYCEPCSNNEGVGYNNNRPLSQEDAMTRSVLDCLPVYPPYGHPTPGSPSSYNCMRRMEELQQPLYPTIAEFNNYYANMESSRPC